MLYGRNGCARKGCPESLNEAITELNNDAEFIDDVQLTESGNWLVLFVTMVSVGTVFHILGSVPKHGCKGQLE